MSVIYDSINFKLLAASEPVPFTNNKEKKLRNITYDDKELVFSFKNKTYEVDEIHTNNYDKQYIEVKSNQFREFIDSLNKHFGCTTTTNIRINITPATRIHDLENKKVTELYNDIVLLSISVPTLYEDDKIKTLQLNAREIVVVEKIPNKTLKFDIKNLSLSE